MYDTRNRASYKRLISRKREIQKVSRSKGISRTDKKSADDPADVPPNVIVLVLAFSGIAPKVPVGERSMSRM